MLQHCPLIFSLIAILVDPVSDWFDVHHRLQEDSPLLLPKTQVSRFFLLPGRRVSGVVSLANRWNAGGELRLCAFIQVSPVRVFLRQLTMLTFWFLQFMLSLLPFNLLISTFFLLADVVESVGWCRVARRERTDGDFYRWLYVCGYTKGCPFDLIHRLNNKST